VDDERWQALVRRLEPEAREDPAAYRRKVLALAALGYAFIATLLIVLLGLGALVVVLALKGSGLLLKLLIPIGALFLVITRSLWVKLDAPDGVPLKRADARKLFEMIDDIRRRIRGPRVHKVLVDGEANAGVVQIPRAGGVLGSRNYLVLGLPYLKALSADEFSAVVAHELGHLSRSHGRFGAFVYRVRETWFQLLEGLERRKSLWTGAVRRFFVWYVPYFNAYTLPLARAHEFEADDAAAEVAGREPAASSLVKGMLAARWAHESYWPKIYQRALDEPAPPRTAFAPMLQEIEQASRSDDVDRWYRQMLEIETDVFDTHPSLAERLAHFGLDPPEVLRLAQEDSGPSAASTYLGDAEADVVVAVDRAWYDDVAPAWEHQHTEAQSSKAKLELLDTRDTLSPEEALERAQLTETFRDPDQALALYRELVDTENDSPARFAIGRLLLEREDDEGLRWLDEAMERDPDAVLPACQIAYLYLSEHDREEEAQAYHRRAEQQVDVLERATDERSEVSVEDNLEAPDFDGELLEGLRQKIAWHDEVVEAYLIRKRTQHFDDTHPFYVLAVVPKSSFRTAWKESDDDAEPLEERVARDISLPGEHIVVKVDQKSPLAQHFAQIDGARVFERT
jgi:Zn-dependent protease with chaperone function